MTSSGIVKMGWTDEENLVCVHTEGSVYVYSLHGERVASFHLGAACTEDKVAECHIWETGLVVRTTRSDFFAIRSFDDPQPYKLADIYQADDARRRPPSAMCVIAPRFNESDEPEVLVATAEGSIVVIDRKSAVDMRVEHPNNAPFVKMAVSPNAKKVACFDTAGIVL